MHKRFFRPITDAESFLLESPEKITSCDSADQDRSPWRKPLLLSDDFIDNVWPNRMMDNSKKALLQNPWQFSEPLPNSGLRRDIHYGWRRELDVWLNSDIFPTDKNNVGQRLLPHKNEWSFCF
jgi:hypothetical protein